MAKESDTSPITVRTDKRTDAWQIDRIKEGLADARAGRVFSVDNVFAEIAAKHGWQRCV